MPELGFGSLRAWARDNIHGAGRAIVVIVSSAVAVHICSSAAMTGVDIQPLCITANRKQEEGSHDE